MSDPNRAGDTEWLAESLSAVLEADPSTIARRGWEATDRDSTWAGLMGPAGMSFTPADLRVDDIPALIVRLFDVAIDEWFEQEDDVDGYPADGAEVEVEDEGPLDTDAAMVALSDDCPLVDDRTTDEVLWSLLVDSWWRAAPPFAKMDH